MKRAVIKLKDGSYINIPADTFEFDKGMLIVKNGTSIVSAVRIKEITSCHISN